MVQVHFFVNIVYIAIVRNIRYLIVPLYLSMTLGCDSSIDTEDISNYETDSDFRSSGIQLETVYNYNAAFGETPESIATDINGNIFVSLSLTGAVDKIDSNIVRSTVATLPMGNPADCTGPFPAIMGALAIDYNGDIYLPVNSCDLSAKGIYRVSQGDSPSLIATIPPTALGNGIALRLGHVYVSDSASDNIYVAPTDGVGDPADVWVSEPMLADINPYDAIPGANGLQFFGSKMWVTNASANSLITIDLEFPWNGSGEIQPGDSEMVFGPVGSGAVWEQDTDVFPGCDDFSFDIVGGIYCTTDPFETVVRLSTITGHAEIIFDASDGLDGPTSAVFGRGTNRRTLYISNANFPFFPGTGNGPSIMKANLPIGGYPLR